MKSKSIQRMYGQMRINFILDPTNSNIMINATEMAAAFNKRIDVFMKSDNTKAYINALRKLPKDERLWENSVNQSLISAETDAEFPPNGGNKPENSSENDPINTEFPPNGGNSDVKLLQLEDIYQTRGHQGTWMHRLLAIEFAAWLDVHFKVWINITIDNLLFGNYKKHWEAHTIQEEAKVEMEKLKQLMLSKKGNDETAIEYFKQQEIAKNCANVKRKAIADQYNFIEKIQYEFN